MRIVSVLWQFLLKLLRGGSAGQGEADSEPAKASSGELDVGQPYTTSQGLKLTVLGAKAEKVQAVSGIDSIVHVVLRVRAENATEHPVDFDNNFGVVNGQGGADLRSYVDPSNRPSIMPGIATLMPGQSLEGDVYVSVKQGRLIFPAYLTAMGGCQSCPQGVELIPLALWKPVQL